VTAAGPVELSRLGTPAERESLAAALREEFEIEERRDPEATAATLPAGWQEILDDEGRAALVADLARRRRHARILSVVASLAAAGALVLVRACAANPSLIPLTAMACTAAAGIGWGAIRLSRGRMEWRIDSGRVTLRRRLGSRATDVFEGRAVELIAESRGGGHQGFALEAVGPDAPEIPGRRPFKGRRTIARDLHDPEAPRRIGLWLQARAAVPFRDLSTEDRRVEEIARLREALSTSGAIGRLASRLVGRLESR
jgi:hypothetical protein